MIRAIEPDRRRLLLLEPYEKSNRPVTIAGTLGERKVSGGLMDGRIMVRPIRIWVTVTELTGRERIESRWVSSQSEPAEHGAAACPFPQGASLDYRRAMPSVCFSAVRRRRPRGSPRVHTPMLHLRRARGRH